MARIEDDGPGIPEHLIAKAFGVGTRFDPAVTGSGLGLAIAKDLCASMLLDLTLANGAHGLIATVNHPAKSPVWGDHISGI